MASGSDFPDPSSFFERLFSSRNRENLSRIIPIMLSLANPQNSTTPDENSTNPDHQIARERLILINPFTQTMLVIESSNRDRDRDSSNSSDFDSWINDLMFMKEGQPPASKASMDAMPEFEIGEEGVECVICLEELEVGGIGKKMPCNHKFHGGCIEKWLKIHGTCPVCRYKMPVEERDDKIDKEENQSESRGRRRDVWMSFAIGEDDGSIRSGENNESNYISTESADNGSIFVSRTNDHDDDDVEG